MTNTPTVLLAQGLDKDNNVIEVRGTPFYREERTGVADGITALQNAPGTLQQVPAYLLGEGKVAAGRAAEAQGDIQLALQESVWKTWHDTFGETDTILDERGILGQEGQLYVASFQNGGLFVHAPQRIKDAVLGRNEESLTEWYSLQLKQEEVNKVLDAIKRKDVAALREMGVLRGDSAQMFHGFGAFADASALDDFTKGMPSYVVLRTAEAAQRNPSGYQSIKAQRGNEDLAIPFGGVQRSGAVLDVVEKLGWNTFGSHHDGYRRPNSGRVVFVNYHSGGVNSNDNLDLDGRPVGVAPEALVARAKIVKPLEVTVAQEAPTPEVRMVPENDVRRLLTEHLGYAPARVGEHLQVLGSYQTRKQ